MNKYAQDKYPSEKNSLKNMQNSGHFVVIFLAYTFPILNLELFMMNLKQIIISGVPSVELLSMSTSTICLYALFVSSSLLLVYLVIFFAARVDVKRRAHNAWAKLRGRLPRSKTILLHTLSYYLAVTRSTCEVI